MYPVINNGQVKVIVRESIAKHFMAIKSNAKIEACGEDNVMKFDESDMDNVIEDLNASIQHLKEANREAMKVNAPLGSHGIAEYTLATLKEDLKRGLYTVEDLQDEIEKYKDMPSRWYAGMEIGYAGVASEYNYSLIGQLKNVIEKAV